jgi:predicted lipoprotein with Yx(FWY)xxD motif
MTADLGKGSTPMHVVVPTRRVLLLAGPAALVLATAVACSSSTSPGTSTVATSGSSSSATSSGGAASSADALAVATNSSLGQIVTTGSGRTVYRFDADSTNPSKSNCTGGCSSLWPPVLVTGSGTPAVMGVNSSQVGEVTRGLGRHMVGSEPGRRAGQVRRLRIHQQQPLVDRRRLRLLIGSAPTRPEPVTSPRDHPPGRIASLRDPTGRREEP